METADFRIQKSAERHQKTASTQNWIIGQAYMTDESELGYLSYQAASCQRLETKLETHLTSLLNLRQKICWLPGLQVNTSRPARIYNCEPKLKQTYNGYQ